MRNLLLVSFLLCTFYTALSQDDFVKSSISSDSILLGNYFIWSLSIEGDYDHIEFPELEHFDLVAGPNMSSHTQIINGDVSKSTSWTYYLKPIEIGIVILEPAEIIVNNESLFTSPIEIMVYPNPAGIIDNPKDSNTSFFKEFNFPYSSKPQSEKKTTKRKLKKI